MQKDRVRQLRMPRPASILIVAVAAWSALLLASGRAAAQRFQTAIFTETEGLPSSKVLDLRQDPTGRLWVLTRAGLSVYDGQSFSVPHRSVPLRDIAAMTLDPSGQPVVMGADGGPRLAARSGRAWDLLPGPPVRIKDATDRIQIEAIPGSDRRALLLALPDGTYHVWDGRDWRRPLDPPAVPPTAMLARDDGLLVACRDGLFHLGRDAIFHRVRSAALPSGLAVLALAEARSGGWWMLTSEWLGRLDGETLHTVLERDGDGAPGLPAFTLEERVVMIEDGFGGFFFGSSQRAFHLDLQRRRLHPVGTAEGLVAEGALAFLRDRQGGIWIASGRGLTRIASQRFLTYGRAQGLLEPEVTALLEIDGDRMLFGHNLGFTMFDGGHAETLRLDPTPGRVARVLDLARDGAGTLWAAVSAHGLIAVGREGGGRRFGLEYGIDVAQSIEVSPDGSLWVASDNNLFVARGGMFERVPLPVESRAWLRWISFSGDEMSVSTDQGVLRRSTPDSAWQHITHPDPAVADVYRVARDSDQRTWVGTEAGLYRIEDGELVQAFLGGTPIERPVYLVIEDPAGHLWFGTDNGVFVWDGVVLRHLTVRHGLAGRETNRGAALVDGLGRVWIGTESGVSMYQAKYDLRSVSPPAVELGHASTPARSFGLDRPFEVGYAERSLTFYFQAVTLAPELGLAFRCRLLGFDPAWLDPCPARVGTRYTNLPPATYRFQVQARHDDGPWGKISTSAPMTVTPPLWRSGPFRAAIGSVLLAVSWLLWRTFERKRHAADHDPLTGLPNRSWFFRRLARAIERRGRAGRPRFAVLFLDLDGFKHVNDSLGHLVGDQLLVAIAARLRRRLAARAPVARIGGDEFALLLDPVRDNQAVASTVERVRATFLQPFRVAGRDLFSDASLGVVLGESGYARPEEVLRDADSAMYRAKEKGRNRFEVFDPAMLRVASARLELENDLRRAIDAGQLALVYQPIVGLDDRRVGGVEALIRWRHPARGMLEPDAFIEIAEETGLIIPIGTWVIDEACRQLAAWRRASSAFERIRVHVNVAASQLQHGDLLAQLADSIARAAIPASSVVVELTERSIVDDFEAAAERLERLRAFGVPVFLDDFGRGQTSLRYLRRLPLDGLKLDRSFIAGLGADPRELTIARMVSELGRQLGLHVIAEGIETAQQLELLGTLPCHAGQGFFFHRPMDGAAVLDLLRRAPAAASAS